MMKIKFYVDGKSFESFEAVSFSAARRIFDQKYPDHSILYTETEKDNLRTLALREDKIPKPKFEKL